MSEAPIRRRVGVLSVGRSDYGILRPVLRALQDDPAIDLRVFAGGAHLDERFGLTIREIEADGFSLAARMDTAPREDSAAGIADAMGRTVGAFARAFEKTRPDILVALGDRYDMFAAVSAAVPFRIPIAHLHGGETTGGAIDEQFRHALTQLAHLHFVAAAPFADRLRRMGEEPWRVTVCGAPALDNLRLLSLLDRDSLAADLGIPPDPPPLVVTLHPETLGVETSALCDAFFEALDAVGRPVVFTYPNADEGSSVIVRRIEDYCAAHENARAFANLGSERYFSLMACASAMAGNSSSGLIEAASFRLPVVNVGRRQEGRLRPANVIDCPVSAPAILDALRRALSRNFRDGLADLVNPYGDGHAAERIARVLAAIPLDDRLLHKRFHVG